MSSSERATRVLQAVGNQFDTVRAGALATRELDEAELVDAARTLGLDVFHRAGSAWMKLQWGRAV